MTDTSGKIKPCSVCRHAVGYGPIKCGALLVSKLTADAGSKIAVLRLAHEARVATGFCGPEAAFFEPLDSATATLLQFPTPHRTSA